MQATTIAGRGLLRVTGLALGPGTTDSGQPDCSHPSITRVGGPVSTDRTEQDPAVRALTELLTVLDTCMTELGGARTRAEKLLEERQSGRAWLDLVTAESRPLVVAGPLQGPRPRPGSRPEPARAGEDGVLLLRVVGGRGPSRARRWPCRPAAQTPAAE